MANTEENKKAEEMAAQKTPEEKSDAADGAEDVNGAQGGPAADCDEGVDGTQDGSDVADVTEEVATDDGDGEEQDKEESQGDGSEEKKERRLFKKKDKKDKRDEKIAELTDKLTRQMAEFDNYRKRTEKEKAANYQIGARDVIEKLLPVVDNFERGLADADLTSPFADGMNKIYKQLTTLLADLGVAPIEALGNEFDPNLHNAVMHIEDEELGENVVAEEFQKGYVFKDQVLRHSMVKVAN